MGFWGIEVKPEKPYPFHSDNVRGRLHITQATLGLGSSSERSIVQCAVGRKSPIFLCALLPNKIESCSLDLEFEDEELVAFSVIGPRSVHLSGYFVADDGDDLKDDYEYGSTGVDYGETDTDESSDYDTDDDYAAEFTDSDLEMFPASPVKKSGVVIEEIIDDEKPANEDGQPKRAKKKNQKNSLDDRSNSLKQIVVRGDSAVPVLESEDEDGFPISESDKKMLDSKPESEVKPGCKEFETNTKKVPKDGDGADTLKRKSDRVDQGLLEGERKKNKKKKKQNKGESAHESAGDEEINVITEKENNTEEEINVITEKENNTEGVKDEKSEGKLSNEKGQLEKKKKKQEKKKKEDAGVKSTDEAVAKIGNTLTLNSEEKQKEPTKSSKVRTYANGLVVEELSMGKPDGKKASPGSQVSVHYIGKLRNNGKIFDSNVGRAPFKFRLGVGQVIKGWDVGLNGMRIGDKRRITIPPSMGYGAKRAGTIPPNSWLVFDVELVDVR